MVLVATSLAAFTATLDNTVVAVALRDVQQDLGSGVTGLQGIVTAYTVALAALLLAGGALVDRFGARRVLVSGLLGFTVTSVACATAGSVPALVTWRALQGAAAALLLPGGLAVLSAAYPDPERRRRAVGIWAATGGAALVAGPVVGGDLVARYGWPAVFWLNVPLCLLVLVVVLRTPVVPAPHRRRLDAAGALLTCVVLGLATYGVVLAGRQGLSLAVTACGAGALVAAVVLSRVERRPDPLLPIDLVVDRRFRGALLGAFAASLAVFVLLVFVSLFLQLVQAKDAQATGRLLLPLPVALVVTAALAGRWRAVARPVTFGLLLAAAALLVLGVRLREGLAGAELAVLLAVVGAGVGLTTAPVVTAALGVAGDTRAGLAAAGINVARELGGVVAVAGLGALAVARLSSQLSAALTAGGVPGTEQPAILDALLGARTDEVRALLLERVGVAKTLQLRGALNDAATASFVSSTSVVLLAAGAVLALAAIVCGLQLRPGVRPPSPRGRGRRSA